MTPERFKQVRDLADAALDQDDVERPVFLTHACRGDGDLRAEVESLLAAYQEVRRRDFLESPPPLPSDASEEDTHENTMSPGQRLGAYELIDTIGRGGMGVVHRARRADDQYRQVVAIKVIRRGMDTSLSQRRFREERQILAGLEHPGIARLLDGGTTEDGSPFLVMEYVEGESIDVHCDRRRASLAERLRLFISVCAAVHHAHRSLVVHRDLKPANVLVTAEGAAKLLDFGIAKLLQPATAPAVDSTVTAMQMLTPDYASPEQVRGEPVTTATDVYSLGVLLYELLSGYKPFRLKSALAHEVLAAICDEDPPRPSAAVSMAGRTGRKTGSPTVEVTPEAVSDARRLTPRLLRKKLSGDLDTIVLKALRKAPEERYASVEALADDLLRHLEGRPVRARPKTVAYRTSRFLLRNPAAAVAAALALLALLGGMAATARQARVADEQRQRAERRFADVRKLANSFLFEIHDSIKTLPGSTKSRVLLLKRAVEYLDSLAQEAGEDAALQRELATGYQRVADVQGNPAESHLGDTTGALASYRKALAIQEALLAASPADFELARETALSHQGVAATRNMLGDIPGALQGYRRALVIYDGLLVGASRHSPTRRERAIVLYRMAELHRMEGDLARARENADRGMAAQRELAQEDPSARDVRRDLSRSYKLLGLLRADAHDGPGAIAHQRRSLQIREELAAEEPLDISLRHEVASSHHALADAYLEAGDPVLALQGFRRAGSMFEQTSLADPENAQARWLHGLALNTIGRVLSLTRRAESALVEHRRALALFEALSRSDRRNDSYRYNIANTLQLMGMAYVDLATDRATPAGTRLRWWREARAWFERSARVFEDMRTRGTLIGLMARDAETVARELRRCDEALRQTGD